MDLNHYDFHLISSSSGIQSNPYRNVMSRGSPSTLRRSPSFQVQDRRYERARRDWEIREHQHPEATLKVARIQRTKVLEDGVSVALDQTDKRLIVGVDCSHNMTM